VSLKDTSSSESEEEYKNSKGLEIFPRLTTEVTTDEEYMCMENDEECTFMKPIHGFLRSVEE
jgi:hypothetical protein